MRSTAVLFALGLIILSVPAGASAATIVVTPGKSIQAAVDKASPGDTVLVKPGTYTETGRPCATDALITCAVVVTKDNISLVGRPSKSQPVILQNAGGQAQGIEIAKTGDPSCLTDASKRINGSLVSGFTVNNFGEDGIFLFCVDNWRVTQTSANNNAEYGIFPSHSGPGRLDHSVATGANDTGLYVGQSHDVEIDHNTATGNVSGFEIENSSNVRAHDNEATGNTAGILSFTLPFLDLKANANNRIDHNSVHDNNKPNTCLDPAETVCNVPRGTGILLLATDDNQVDRNTVTGNNSFGIGVANLCNALRLNALQCAALDIEPNPDRNRILLNTATGNGTSPDPLVRPNLAADLTWDLSGTGNCWQGNVAGTTFPPILPPCP